MKNTIRKIIIKLDKIGIIHLSDKSYIKMSYYIRMGKELDLNKPISFNEKIQWLKLNDRKEKYTKMVDKYEVKKIITKSIGGKYIIPTLGIYDNFKEINFNLLPNQFVIKCTHDSGGIVICKNKTELNIKKAEKIINKSLKRNYYYRGREWSYKNVKPRIIVEKYMIDKKTDELRDYKFFCFDGKIGIVLVCTNRSVELEETWFDEEFNLIDLTEGGHKNRKDIKKPKTFDEMKRIAKKLSKGIPHVRIDLYEIDGKVYFGEFTFYPASGLERFSDESWNIKLGNMIDLNKVKINEK